MNALGFTHRFVPANPESGTGRVLLLLHGTGGDESQLLSLGRTVDPSAAVLSPRGKISEHGNARFFRRLAEGVFDEEDVIRRAHELADFVEGAATEYRFDLARVVAVGYSNGANVAAAMLLLGRAVFMKAIFLRAMVPFVPPTLPDLSKASLLICEGEHDPIVSRDQAESLAALFRDSSANVTLKYQAAGHDLTPADLATAQEWLAQSDETVS